MVDKIKILIGEDVDNTLIEIYIDRASAVIINYLNSDKITREVVEDKYSDALITLVENMYINRESKNVKAITQGKRSITYSDESKSLLTQEIEGLLPAPYARMW